MVYSTSLSRGRDAASKVRGYIQEQCAMYLLQVIEVFFPGEILSFMRGYKGRFDALER